MLATKPTAKLTKFFRALPGGFDRFERRGPYLILSNRAHVWSGFYFQPTSEGQSLRVIATFCNALFYPDTCVHFRTRIREFAYAVTSDWDGSELERRWEQDGSLDRFRASGAVLPSDMFARKISDTYQAMLELGVPWLDRYASLSGFLQLCSEYRDSHERNSLDTPFRFEAGGYAAILLNRPDAEIISWLERPIELASNQSAHESFAPIAGRCEEMLKLLNNRTAALAQLAEYETQSRNTLGWYD